MWFSKNSSFFGIVMIIGTQKSLPFIEHPQIMVQDLNISENLVQASLLIRWTIYHKKKKSDIVICLHENDSVEQIYRI